MRRDFLFHTIYIIFWVLMLLKHQVIKQFLKYIILLNAYTSKTERIYVRIAQRYKTCHYK